jgi:hypothetical protein
MSTYETISVALQVIIGVVAFATLFLYYRQLRVMSAQLSAMQGSSTAQSGLSLVAFLQTPEVREARRVVREVLSTKPLSDWSPEEKRSAALVVSNYDVAAALIRAGLVPVDLIAANWGPSIRHCHQVLKPFVAEQRGRPGGDERYWCNFDWLMGEATRSRA